LLKKLPTSKIAELSNLSNAYISQVKHEKRPPSDKLIAFLSTLDSKNKNQPPNYLSVLSLFLKSRKEGISPNTLRDYRIILSKALVDLGLRACLKKSGLDPSNQTLLW